MMLREVASAHSPSAGGRRTPKGCRVENIVPLGELPRDLEHCAPHGGSEQSATTSLGESKQTNIISLGETTLLPDGSSSVTSSRPFNGDSETSGSFPVARSRLDIRPQNSPLGRGFTALSAYVVDWSAHDHDHDQDRPTRFQSTDSTDSRINRQESMASSTPTGHGIGIALPTQPTTKPQGVSEFEKAATMSGIIVANFRTVGSLLQEARREGQLRRWGVSSFCLALGLSAMLVGSLFGLYSTSLGPPYHWSWYFGTSCRTAGLFGLLLGILPSYRRTIVAANAGTIMVSLLFEGLAAMSMAEGLGRDDHCCVFDGQTHVEGPCWFAVFSESSNALSLVIGCLLTLRLLFVLLRHGGSPRVLLALWRFLSRTHFLLAFFYLRLFIWRVGYGGKLHVAGISTNAVVTGIFSLATALNCLRRKVQVQMASLGQVSSAAGIAALMGNQEPAELLKAAPRRFRRVALERIYFDDMILPVQGPLAPSEVSRFYQFSQPARLGSVDAFVSHSWHDDAPKKWKVLQNWRSKFRGARGREPWLWIDRFCIDQTDVASDLACMPVFLAGCKRMLILWGRTYLQRLWCICEIYIFLEMGGLPSQIEIQVVAETREEVQKIQADIESFDVASARCFKPTDQDRLRTMIRASYPCGFDEFNCKLREALQEASRARTSREHPSDGESTGRLHPFSTGHTPSDVSSILQKGITGFLSNFSANSEP